MGTMGKGRGCSHTGVHWKESGECGPIADRWVDCGGRSLRTSLLVASIFSVK